MKQLEVNQLMLFYVPTLPMRVTKRKTKKKQSKKALKAARRRWRVTYKLRKRGVNIKTNAREILIQEKPSENPTKGWVDELRQNGYHVQFTIN